MLEALIPYITAPERMLAEDVPFIGDLKLQFFGPLVAVGVILGWRQCLKYAKFKDIDEFLFRDYLFWMLVSAFVISHWVSVLFYFPDQVKEDPWVLLAIWNGLSSVGGFFGAWIGMVVYLKIHKQPIMPYADATIFGLLLGWCFGRLGCSVVHDHPGKVVEEGTFLAVGPWPDGSWRYDLGLLEFLFVVSLCLVVYFVIDWKNKPTGWLVGFVALCYAPFRFVLDFFRAEDPARGVIGTPDIRYVGLTTAQWFTVLFALAGIWLMFFRKPKPSDTEYAKDSERIEREKKEAAEASAAKSADPDDEGPDDEDSDDEGSDDADAPEADEDAPDPDAVRP